MSLATAIIYLYPEADPLRDFRVENGGSGGRLVYWDTGKLGFQPSAKTLETASADAEAEHAATQYQRDREAAYTDAYANAEFKEAIFEYLLEGKPEKLAALQFKRQEIKTLYPKPS